MTDMGRDTKTYPICNPYHGEEGPKWSRIFKPDFISGLGTVTDKFSSIAKHIVGRDVGGIQPFAPRLLDPAAPGPNAGALVGCAPVVTRAHAGGAAEVRESRAAFDLRSEAGISQLRRHIPNNALHTLIDKIVQAHELEDYAGVNGIPAPVIEIACAVTAAAGGIPAHIAAPQYAADHPNAGTPLSAHDLEQYQKNGNSLFRHVFAAVDKRCTKDITSALANQDQETIWATLGTGAVGVGPRLVFDLRMHIDTINQERATLKTTEECRQKLLMILASRPELNKEVTAELVHASLPCRVGPAITGDRPGGSRGSW